MRRGLGIVGFVTVVQTVLFLTHFLLYETWTYLTPADSKLWLQVTLGLLSISFIAASVLAYRYTNPLLRTFYRAAAVWLGLLTFLFVAALAAWIVYGVAQLTGAHVAFHRVVEWLFATAVVVGMAGIVNANWTRVTHATIRLANLPEAWRGRKAALISDLHLGHVRNGNFLRRMVSLILSEGPDAIFIAGDLYDGTYIDAQKAAAPLSKLSAPQGVYFVAGNHEQFRDEDKYVHAVKAAGVRVLHNEKIEADGLQIVGVPYRNALRAEHLASVLQRVKLDRERASILLLHAPHHPEVAEAAGVSLQLSGHTHLGQFIPWSWFARKIYRQLVYGLSRIGKMQIFTSSGAGTWGPPLRLGSNPEIVMLQFE